LQEIQLLALSGYAVAAVNYRGSTGYGTAFRERNRDVDGQVSDVWAALQWLRSRPDVDVRQLSILGVCYGGSLVARALGDERESAGPPATAIQWMASTREWLQLSPRQIDRLLWIFGGDEIDSASARAVQQALASRGIRVDSFGVVGEGHAFLLASHRAQAYIRLVRALNERSE
jgi:dienelactone hydrolase